MESSTCLPAQKNLDLTALFENPIAFHRVFARLMGNAAGGLFLGQLNYWSIKMRKKGNAWFYKTAADWHDETMLSRREIENARKKLQGLGILEIKRKGVPAKIYFKVNHEALSLAISQFAICDNLECTAEDPSLSDVTNKSATNDNQECQMLQTTTETTQRLNRDTTTSTNKIFDRNEPQTTAYPMPKDWQPSDLICDLFEEQFHPDLKDWVNDKISGFIYFWTNRKTKRKDWNGKLVQWVMKGYEMEFESQQLTKNTTAAGNLTDRSWADNLMEAGE